MKAVVLAGGKGVRLRPLTYTIPKPLLPVGEKPILEEIIERLKSFGLREFIIAVGYRAELIEVPAVPYSNPNNYVKLSGRLAVQLAKTEEGFQRFLGEWLGETVAA